MFLEFVLEFGGEGYGAGVWALVFGNLLRLLFTMMASPSDRILPCLAVT